MAWKEANKKMPGLKERYKGTGELSGVRGAESFDECRKRICLAIKGIAEKSEGKNVLVFSHGTVLRIFLANVMGIKGKRKKDMIGINVDNCSVNTVTHENGKFGVGD
jgi:broad specificity phosphatase PhoE